MAGKRGPVLVALAILIATASAGLANARASPGSRLLTYLWNYGGWSLRSYVSGVTVAGGHTVTVDGKSRLTGATANVHVTLRDEPKLADAARHICRIAAEECRSCTSRPWSPPYRCGRLRATPSHAANGTSRSPVRRLHPRRAAAALGRYCAFLGQRKSRLKFSGN